jgi:hypothetical protein
MVLRDDKLYKVKPSEVKPGDEAMSVEVMYGDIVEGADKITSCVHTGEYKDEYVYDIEMDDDNHTFYAQSSTGITINLNPNGNTINGDTTPSCTLWNDDPTCQIVLPTITAPT